MEYDNVSTMNRYYSNQPFFVDKLANDKCKQISVSYSSVPALPAVPILPSSTVEKEQRA